MTCDDRDGTAYLSNAVVIAVPKGWVLRRSSKARLDLHRPTRQTRMPGVDDPAGAGVAGSVGIRPLAGPGTGHSPGEIVDIAPIDARARSKNSRAVKLLGGAGALALLVGGVTLAVAPSATADGIVQTGHPSCAELIPGSTEVMFENPQLGAQTRSAPGVSNVVLTGKRLLADDPFHPGDQTGDFVVYFTTGGGPALGVIVIGGPDANFYDYRPDGTHGRLDLHPPVDDGSGHFYAISQVSVCVIADVPSPTPTPTPTPSSTPTPTPTLTPTATPTPTPSDTPSGTPSTEPSQTPGTTPSGAPTGAPSGTPSDTPGQPSSATPSSPWDVPTEVDAGGSGGTRASSAHTTTAAAVIQRQSVWGVALLGLGGALLISGLLKTLRRRGQRSS
ncbi:hypothetical protein [Kribbella sp. NBC_00359]|uniref:hypothetical protein n=1 Tax=Kribbella sp. NBC_00359 TaxID=2975966 RepID=UPI002E1FA6EA